MATDDNTATGRGADADPKLPGDHPTQTELLEAISLIDTVVALYGESDASIDEDVQPAVWWTLQIASRKLHKVWERRS